MEVLTSWLILKNTKCPKLQRLAMRLGSALALFKLDQAELQAKGISPESIQALHKAKQSSVEADLNWLKKSPTHHILCWEDPAYPLQLKEIHAAPSLLYIKGHPALMAEAQIAIVGSRNPSPMGFELAHEFSLGLSAAGFIITSGLALGIDAASHQAALENNSPTIAVLGSGLEHIYPRHNQELARKITGNGALISEYAPFTPPLAHHFPQRNRIISGLSHGTLVIEASLKSGSLITARLANEQGREVFAVPGSPHHALAAGCNQLIQQGAKLVSDVQDLLDELQPSRKLKSDLTTSLIDQFNELELDTQQYKLLECVGFEISSVDQIAVRSGLPPEVVNPLLLELELKGFIRTSIGGHIRNLASSKLNRRMLTDRE